MEKRFVQGPFKEVARVVPIAGKTNCHYVDTTVDTSACPTYRLNPYYDDYSSPFFSQINADSIRKSLLHVVARQNTNGYDLTVEHPVAYGRYLVLVRDRMNKTWRAGGYFESDAAGSTVQLSVDKKGMMSKGQAPAMMPAVRFLPDVVEPAFTAGWGEDSDGDGLPDIYEVLVTKTDPVNADTGGTGLLDGYKDMAKDGWSNLEKFRRRADPRKSAKPPQTIILKQPTMTEVMRAAVGPQGDLRYEPQIQLRVAGTKEYQPIQQTLRMYYVMIGPQDWRHVRGNFDVRILWRIPARPTRTWSIP